MIEIGEGGEVLETFMLQHANEPVKYTLKIESEEDMGAEVVISSTASIEIPELEIKILPDTYSENYISDVEGVLLRIEDALKRSKELLPGNSGVDGAISKIEEIKEGKRKATLILLDPSGNSFIGGAASKERINT